MIFIHLTGNADMIVTDPQGRRFGYNPFTWQSFSEIPGGNYITAESISDPNDANIFTTPEVRFEGVEAIAGQYKVQVFAKGDTNYQLVSYKFDSTGTINGINDKKGSLKSRATAESAVDHSVDAIPVRTASLNIKKADFYDSRHRDMAYISGLISPTDGHGIRSIDKYLQIKVGPFVRSIDKKQLIKYKYRGQTIYTNGAFWNKGMLILLNADTGEFELLIGNVDLDDSNPSLITDVTIQADDVISRSIVTFKNVRKKHSNDK